MARRGKTVNSRTRRAMDNKHSISVRACQRMLRARGGGGSVRGYR